MTDFDRFWQAYPRKVAKAAARREFAKAILKTDIESILSGVEAYKSNKPDYQDWAHARTWLYQERWEDEWEETAAGPLPYDEWDDEAKRMEAKILEVGGHGCLYPEDRLKLWREGYISDETARNILPVSWYESEIERRVPDTIAESLPQQGLRIIK